jgi:hypothetical protein
MKSILNFRHKIEKYGFNCLEFGNPHPWHRGRHERRHTAGSGKSLKRQHSQANQKYHQNAPSVSCGAHSGVKRIAFWIFSVLAQAEGEPRDLSKNGRPKEPDT